MGLKVEVKPPRLVCLKLKIIDKTTGERTSSNFSVKYHDMPGVTDFVILKQIYDRGIDKNWKAKDRFRCIIDDVWWFGTIESREPFDVNYPDSPFQCFNVVWDSLEKEKLSPWDLEPINTKKCKCPIGGLPVQ
jgi:bromodomain and WD repeat domain-containing protein 1/3